MQIILKNTSEKPLYLQIYEQISTQILNNTIPADFCLPSIRQLAKDLRISVITAKNAYELLEKSNLIYTIAGKGCFVKKQNIKAKNLLINEKISEIRDFCNKYNIDIKELANKLK